MPTLIERKQLAILIFDKVNFRAKKMIRDKERHFTRTKESTHPEGTDVLNVSVPETEQLNI